MFMSSFRLNLENEHISVDTALCVCYNALYIKLFALYNNIFFMKVNKNQKPV